MILDIFCEMQRAGLAYKDEKSLIAEIVGSLGPEAADKFKADLE